MTQETVVSIVDLRLIMMLADISEHRKREEFNRVVDESVEAVLQAQRDSEFAGFHKFRHDDGSEHGSFEVFYASHSHDDLEPGWYWWPCFSGCLPDGDANGPFPTAEGAYLDALGD